MTRIQTPFGPGSTAAEVLKGVGLEGRRAIVTGGASGIGKETASALAAAGAEVTLAIRDLDAGQRAAAEISPRTGPGKVSVLFLDLADPASVSAFGGVWRGPLDILVNNAGVMACPEARTRDGLELQLATNHIGHFALTLLLHRALAAARRARIVSVSSAAHMISPFVFDDPNFQFRLYDPWLAYGQSKTANILFAVGAAERFAQDGITANALDPGAIATNLQRHVGGQLRTPPERRKTPAQGAATSALLAASPLLEGVSGRYFADCNEAELVSRRRPDYGGLAPYAKDPENAERLWETSLRLIQGRGA